MAHIEQKAFCTKIKEKYPDYFKNKKVLDVGSLDLNGNNRFLFENCSYIGIDVGIGANVDVVYSGHLYDAPDNYFDTIISTEAFEHDMYYEQTINNIIRMLKPGGLFIFTCAAPGRPEHGTRRNGQFDAPLLIEVSEQWADYYKNLTPEDIRKSPSFDISFPDGKFEINNNAEIPSDLYFYGVKGGIKYLTNSIVPEYPINNFDGDIFVIDSWVDNKLKENDLINLIKRLKTYNIPILLSGHFPINPEIQKMVDYYLFDKNNPLLSYEQFTEFNVDSLRWASIGNIRIENIREFHHDYAIWETMRNAFNFCKYLGKKNIHFMEYDNLPDTIQYRQTFMEKIRNVDAVIYEYHKKSSSETFNPSYCATYIFSIKTDIAIQTIDQIKNKDEFFKDKPNRWQLERNFLSSLKKVTKSINVCEYIANDNELNMQAVWNGDRGNKNGPFTQFYLGANDYDDLYINTVSGTGEKNAKEDYFVEIVYGNYKKFQTIKKGFIDIHKIGKYQKGESVKVYYQGIEIYNQFLGYDIEKFRKLNKVIDNSLPPSPPKAKNTMEPTENRPNEVRINFLDGPLVEIKEKVENTFHVQFINQKSNKIEYELDLKSNHWAKCSKKYYVDWLIRINGITVKYNLEHVIDCFNRRVLISFESKAIGDTISWFAYVEKFRVDRNCHIICSTFHNYLFKNQYPEIEFIEPGTIVNDVYALYRIGYFKTGVEIDYFKHPNDPKKEPLTKVASDILGLDYVELKPKLPVLATEKKKRVSIAIHGTAQCKYWNNLTGWQEVVDFLNSKGYEVRLLSREDDGYMGNNNPKNVTRMNPGSSLEEVLKAIQESELFIGISSGLAWLSWASGIKTILISGFTDVYTEPTDGIYRIINKDVCNSCWSNYDFNPGDWNWCPVHKGTDKQFECSKKITSEQVITEIKIALGVFNKKMNLENEYNIKCQTISDINEHLPTLKKYSEECDHITEMGVRYAVSTFAFLMGKPKKLVSYDWIPMEKYDIDTEDLKYIAKSNGIDFEFILGDTTKVEIEETDFLFIDTEHTYEQAKTELKLHANKVKKYIGFHDTTSNEFEGSVKGHKGLWPAIEEFLNENPNWTLHERFTNNNGLTILKRK